MKTLLLLFLPLAVIAQSPRASGVVVVFNIPTGNCAYNAPVQRLGPSNALYGCLLPTYASLTGTWGAISSGGGSGVTSVGFSTNLGTVSGSPVTTSGILTQTVTSAQIAAFLSATSPITLSAGGVIACASCSTGGATIPSTTNIIKGDGAGNGADSGYVAQNASASLTGFLTSTDWNTFNNKVPATRNINTTSPITGGGDLSADRTIACATCVTSAAALTSNLPVFGAGSQTTAVGTRSGNTTEVATVTGSTPSGNCAQWDASGNLVSSGGACGTGGGSNTGCPAPNINVTGLVCLEDHTAAALSTALNFTTCLGNTQFDEFQIHLINLFPAVAQLEIQLHTSGSYDTGNNYNWATHGSNTLGSGGLTSGFQLWNSNITIQAGSPGYNGVITIFTPATTATWRTVGGFFSVDINSFGLFDQIYSGEWRNTTTAADGFRIVITSTGTFSGEVRCYGVQH